MRANHSFAPQSRLVYVVAVFFSLLISWWISARQLVINPDAICYLYSAQEFGKSGLRAAMTLCPQAIWPFFSVLVYGFQKFTFLTYTNAAYVLDAIFSAISVVAFIAVVKELGASRRGVWLAAAVILLGHEFNSVKQYIIRDHGFWAFYLTSLYYLVRFFKPAIASMKGQAFQRRDAIFFSISLGIATLFRIEGGVFLLLLPFLVWFNRHWTWRERASAFFWLNLPLLIMCFIGAIRFWYARQFIGDLGRVAEIPHHMQYSLIYILTVYKTAKAAMLQHVLSQASARDAGLVIFLTFISWYLVNIINNLSWIFAGLVGYAWMRRYSFFTGSSRLVIMGFVVINLIITGAFFAQNLFLAKRYLIGLTLILMLWVPFTLDRLYQMKWRGWFYLAAVAILVTALGGIFHFGHSKDFIRHAGDWIALETPKDARVYSNDYQVMYYSQRFDTSIFEKIRTYANPQTIAQGKWKQYDYLALRMNRAKDDKTAYVMQEIHLEPVQVFINNSGDGVYIYQINKQ